jgi:hypothetical protein
LSVSAVPSDGITVQLDTSGPQPYINFNVCDFLWVIDHTGARTKYRVSSISASESEDGSVSFVPELGTLRADLTKRLNRALSSLESKNANGISSSGTATAPIGTGGGQIILLPGGVIQPAVVNIDGGYPLNLSTTLATVMRFFSPLDLRYDIRDLTSQGFFTRTLAIHDQVESPRVSRFYNLDNMSQGFVLASGFGNNGGPFKVINGTYYSFSFGISRWTGSDWVDVVLANSSWQVGNIWYAIGVRPGDAQQSLWAFDETTETLSQVIGSGWGNLSASGSIVGNGYAWALVGTVPYWLDLSAPTSWTRLAGTGFTRNKGALGMDVDGNLIGFNLYAGGPRTFIHVLDRTGVVSITNNPFGFLQDIVADGGQIFAVARDATDSVYSEPKTSLGTTSGWVLISVIYSTGENPTGRLAGVFAVGPYGYTPVVYSEDPVYMVGSRENPHGYQGFEWLSYLPDSNEGAMRGALWVRHTDFSVPNPTLSEGYQAFEWSLPVITP